MEWVDFAQVLQAVEVYNRMVLDAGTCVDARRQSVAVAESPREPEDQTFIDVVTDFGDA